MLSAIQSITSYTAVNHVPTVCHRRAGVILMSVGSGVVINLLKVQFQRRRYGETRDYAPRAPLYQFIPPTPPAWKFSKL